MATRTIEHPDVEITELDLSQYTPGLAMTTNLVMGFAEQGEELIPQVITSKNSFLNYYGTPTNDAERYSLAAAEEVFNQNGTLVFSRIPYENQSKQQYRYIHGSLIDDVLITSASINSIIPGLEENVGKEVLETAEELFSTSAAGFKRISINTTPKNMTTEQFDALRTMNSFPDNITASSGPKFVIVNKSRDVAFGDEENAGIFTVIVPAYNALKQRAGIRSNPINGYYNWAIFNGIKLPSLPNDRTDTWKANEVIDNGNVTGYEWEDFVFPPLTRDIRSDSTSKIFASKFPSIKYLGDRPDPSFLGQVAVLVCKSYFSNDYDTKLSISILESHVGSMNKLAASPDGKSIFIGDVINSNSNFIEFYMDLPNPFNTDYILKTNESGFYTIVDSEEAGTDGAGEVASTITWPLLSFTKEESQKKISYTSIISSMSSILDRVKNIDEYEIDLVIDGGISSIAHYVYPSEGIGGIEYTPEYWDNEQDIDSSADTIAWKEVCSKLIEFCQFTRRDCFALLDCPRSIVLRGNLKYDRSTTSSDVFDTQVIPKMRYLTGLNTNYAALYTNWMKILDQYTGKTIWIPPTSKVVGTYNFIDRVSNVFDAPAGLNNGIISGINDISFNPNGEQADQIYSMGFNYAKRWPFQGFTVEGQKTLQNKLTSFDRVNVRRMFLRIERLFRKVALYSLYRPNNFVTRVQLYDLLSPILEQMKSAGGIQEYLLVINESNNTPEVIENNELKIAVFIKPTKIAEYIRATFVATAQGVSLDELQGAILPRL